QKTKDIKVPVAISVFPHEIYQAPESWSKQAYPTILRFTGLRIQQRLRLVFIGKITRTILVLKHRKQKTSKFL
ncbi:hypothetical protein, partial [Chryseobacterium sp. CH1]|uniref:hypothetical protein n=1 Tax=Chryseobacterium sp. CH1 TaxID=713551 RepID=UPI0013E8F9FA